MKTTESTSPGRQVVVAGGSFAGLGAAYTLRQRLEPNDRVTLISPSGHFVFAPSLVWAALGQPLKQSSFPLEPALRAKGIEFLRSHVRRVQVAEKVIVTDKGEMPYDRLIIATGGRPQTSGIPGLAGEFRAASWVVGEDSAMEARNLLRGLMSEPGPLVIGAAQGASYISAAYELALGLDAALRREGIRHGVPMTFVTAEPYLGHLGFGQTAARAPLEKLFSERDIATRVGVAIEHIHRHQVEISSGETLQAAAIVIMPPFTGDVDIWKSAKLTDEHGMIPVNGQYRHIGHADIYAAGVACSFQQSVPPLNGYGPPHTGYLSLRMGKAAAENAAASLGCGEPASSTLPYVLDTRVLDAGDTGVFLASWGKQDLRNTAYRLPGAAGHALKAAIERYLLWRLRTGRMDLP
jgi:sulfide:quinone oxidoreductase